ncbi:MAG TPA: hypothetical protein P5150_09380 [Candidatus Ratteibacteria bacterium]|nr:hypothetical protein [Candidatus Ratteibacteria bacterium]
MKRFLVVLFLLSGVSFSRDVDPEKIAKENLNYFQSIPIPKPEVKLEQPKISFKTSLAIAQTPKTHQIKLQGKTTFPDGTKFVIFGVDDVSKNFFKKNKNFSYGYCVNFRNLDEIKQMKEELKLNFPTGVVMQDDVWKKVFNISSYPAVIEIQKDTLIIKEGL